MSEEDLEYRVSVTDVDAAIAELNRLKGEMDRQVQATERLDEGTQQLTEEEKKASQAKQELTKSAAGASMSFTELYHAGVIVFGAIRAGIDTAARLAEEWEKQSAMINSFSGDIEEATRRMGRTVTQMDLMRSQNALLQAGIRVSGRDFANMAVAADALADATGGTTTEALATLQASLIAGNERGLKPFGLSIDETMSKSDQLADVMAQLESKFGDVTASADTAGGSIDVIKNGLSDMSTAFIESINQSQDFKDAMDALSGTGENTWQPLIDGAHEFAVVVGYALKQTIDGIYDLTEAMGNVGSRLMEGDFAGAMAASDAGQSQFAARLRNILSGRDLAGALAGDQVRRMAMSQVAMSTNARTRRVGGGGGRSSSGGATTSRDSIVANANPLEDIAAEYRARTDASMIGGGTERFDDVIGQYAAMRTEAENTNARIEELDAANKERFGETAKAFEESWRGGIDSVIDSMALFDEAAQRAGNSAADLGKGIKLGLRGELNELSHFLGSTMKSSLQSSVGAWVDGQASMGKAVDQFVNSAINALTKHALIQTITESASALASLAVLDFRGAALHGASAAMWGSVAGAAGLVGLATGAVGGGESSAASAGGGGGSTPSRFDNASPGVSEGNHTTIINLGTFPLMDEAGLGFTVERCLAAAGRQGGVVIPRGGRRAP